MAALIDDGACASGVIEIARQLKAAGERRASNSKVG
jgi:hypothetical protein